MLSPTQYPNPKTKGYPKNNHRTSMMESSLTAEVPELESI